MVTRPTFIAVRVWPSSCRIFSGCTTKTIVLGSRVRKSASRSRRCKASMCETWPGAPLHCVSHNLFRVDLKTIENHVLIVLLLSASAVGRPNYDATYEHHKGGRVLVFEQILMALARVDGEIGSSPVEVI